MSSQEESLDKLLNDLTDDLTKDLGEEVPAITTEEEENIAASDDLMSLLGGSGDEDLLEIQNLLMKADNNEIIEDDIVSLLEGIEEEGTAKGAETAVLSAAATGSTLEKLEEQSGDVSSEMFVSAEEKKRQREAKKAEKKAESEAKKAEKLAQKEAKKAEKLAQKEAKKAEKAAKKKAVSSMQENIAEDGMAMPGDENMPQEAATAEASDNNIAKLEEDIFAGIATLDLFGDADIDVSGVDGFADAAGEDSLEQIIKDEKKAEKKGFFSRMITFFTEEDAEEENENVPISDENREIMKEMDKEGKKKKKDKKSKKAKKGEAPEGDTQKASEDGAEGEEQDSKKKKKKEKKPKKEKAPKVKVVEETNRKRLSFKHVSAILAVCLSIGVLIILATTVAGDYAMKIAGRQAYYEGDYQTCYQSLYGKQLTETEQVMYSKSESILTMRMWIREYEILAQEGSELEALDSLLQSVYEYPTVYLYADKWNAGVEVSELYGQILYILSEKYGLTQEQAMEIANTPNDVEYTKMVMAIVAGEGFGSWNGTEEKQEEVVVLPDVLPEEAGLGNSAFVDNKAAK